MTLDHTTGLLVKEILRYPLGHRWTVQGLGMMRMYLSKELRLHIWDGRLKYAGSSTIHTHPWDFESQVVSGRLENVIYDYRPASELAASHWRQKLHCGPGGCVQDKPDLVLLQERVRYVVAKGYMNRYSELAEEIHESRPVDGTVTLVTRRFRPGMSEDHAFVFWPKEDQWTSAEPRTAKPEEVEMATSLALERWDA